MGCDSLTGLALPQGITSIPQYLCANCTRLQTVQIPEGVISIGYGSFSNCRSLTSMPLPSTLSFIDELAFNDCAGLKSIVIPTGITTLNSQLFGTCTSLSSVILPQGLTKISRSVFFRCIKLDSLVLPASIESIEAYVFYNSPIKKLYSMNTLPPDLDDEGFTYKSGCTLCVPAGSKSNYETADGWGGFKAVIELDPTNVSKLLDSPLEIYNDGDGIVVKGALTGSFITIYNLVGVEILTVKSNGDEQWIELPKGAVYCVKVGDKMLKVAM